MGTLVTCRATSISAEGLGVSSSSLGSAPSPQDRVLTALGEAPPPQDTWLRGPPSDRPSEDAPAGARGPRQPWAAPPQAQPASPQPQSGWEASSQDAPRPVLPAGWDTAVPFHCVLSVSGNTLRARLRPPACFCLPAGQWAGATTVPPSVSLRCGCGLSPGWVWGFGWGAQDGGRGDVRVALQSNLPRVCAWPGVRGVSGKNAPAPWRLSRRTVLRAALKPLLLQ